MSSLVEKHRWFIELYKESNKLSRAECEEFAYHIKYKEPYDQLVNPEIIIQALREIWSENHHSDVIKNE